eukprot:2748699-Prymnesium_polylepis.1
MQVVGYDEERAAEIADKAQKAGMALVGVWVQEVAEMCAHMPRHIELGTRTPWRGRGGCSYRVACEPTPPAMSMWANNHRALARADVSRAARLKASFPAATGMRTGCVPSRSSSISRRATKPEELGDRKSILVVALARRAVGVPCSVHARPPRAPRSGTGPATRTTLRPAVRGSAPSCVEADKLCVQSGAR